ncbi:hypothetical protein A3862_04560 [Methylobacterium sp. XJLW]|nr:hypothetical protein A3862_04560 [Methylobacterium sp. XJLW]
MTRRSSKKAAAQTVLSAGDFGAQTSDCADRGNRRGREERAVSPTPTFAAEGLEERDAALAALEIQPEDVASLALAQEIGALER